MAIISTKGIYGLTAVLILAREERHTLLQIKDIATKGDIPQNYLEQILVVLKKNGFVESIRGANGGYKLSKSPNDISVYEILDSLECCLSFNDNKNSSNFLDPFWEDVQKKIKKIFLLSISELEEFLEKNSKSITYYI